MIARKHTAGVYVAWLLAVVMLGFAVSGRHPYSFYVLLRWICCGAFAYSAFTASEKNRVTWAWVFGLLAVLFNPVVPVHLQRDTWQIVDWGTIGVIVIAAIFFWRGKEIQGKAFPEPSMRKDFYSILGVSTTATAAEIKERFRFLSHAYHPDKFATAAQREAAEYEFKQINEAYQILSDPSERANYDRERSRETSSDSARTSPPDDSRIRSKAPRNRRVVATVLVVILAISLASFVIWSTRESRDVSARHAVNQPLPRESPMVESTPPIISDEKLSADAMKTAKPAEEIKQFNQAVIQDSLVKPTHLTPEEQTLLDKGQYIEMIGGPHTHSGHMVSRLSPVGDGKNAKPAVCFVFGMEDIEPARKEGESMAQFHYSRSQAEQFLFAQGWDKYHDRFFTRYYVQEGMDAYDKNMASEQATGRALPLSSDNPFANAIPAQPEVRKAVPVGAPSDLEALKRQVDRATPPMAKPTEHEYRVNPNLPADAIELAPTEKPKTDDYYQTPPEKRSINVPSDYILTRVFQGTTFLGWAYLPKKTVSALHNLSRTPAPRRRTAPR